MKLLIEVIERSFVKNAANYFLEMNNNIYL